MGKSFSARRIISLPTTFFLIIYSDLVHTISSLGLYPRPQSQPFLPRGGCGAAFLHGYSLKLQGSLDGGFINDHSQASGHLVLTRFLAWYA